MKDPSQEKPVCRDELADWAVSIVDSKVFLGDLDSFQLVYERSFALPEARREAVIERFRRHVQKNQFTACVVRTADGSLAAFSYGYLGAPGDWWHDRVRGNMDSDLAIEWMADSFEVAEVVVDPAFQGRGIGGMLVQELCKFTRARTVLLTVRTDNTNARKLYDRLGFVILIDSLFFPGDDYPYAVMGCHRQQLVEADGPKEKPKIDAWERSFRKS